ncbi:MAG: hypothetical protein WC956_02300 [bacterium]
MKGRIAISFFILSLLAACHEAGMSGNPWENLTPGSPGFNTSLPIPLTGDVISCEKHSDCGVVELGCCDHCNGGFAAAVNIEHGMDVQQSNAETCEEDHICTQMACEFLYAACEGGQCVTTKDGYDLCDTDDDCVAVELGCCDHCNGGSVMAANKNSEALVRGTFGEFCVAEPNGVNKTICTLMACPAELAKCDAGRCVTYTDPTWIKPVEE